MKARVGAVALTLPLLFGTAACGSGDTPVASEQVPALSARLDAVDGAIAAHRYPLARQRLAALVEETTTARESGDLDEATAQQILAAAARLLTSLPEAIPTPTATPTPTPAAKPKPEPKKPDGHPGKKHGRDKGDDDERLVQRVVPQ